MSMSFEVITVNLRKVCRVTRTKVSDHLETRDFVESYRAVLSDKVTTERRNRVVAITDGDFAHHILSQSTVILDSDNNYAAKALVEQRIGQVVDCDLYRLNEKDMNLIIASGKALINACIDDPLSTQHLDPGRVVTFCSALKRLMLTKDLRQLNVFVRING